MQKSVGSRSSEKRLDHPLRRLRGRGRELQNGDGKASSGDLSSEDRANARKLERHRRKASSVVWNCALFTERGKKRPWLDAFAEPHLRQWNGDAKSERDVRGSIAHGRGRAKTPLRKPGDSPKRGCCVVKRHSPRTQVREPRDTGAVVRSWLGGKNRSDASFAVEGAREGNFSGCSKQLAPKELPRQLTHRGTDQRRMGALASR